MQNHDCEYDARIFQTLNAFGILHFRMPPYHHEEFRGDMPSTVPRYLFSNCMMQWWVGTDISFREKTYKFGCKMHLLFRQKLPAAFIKGKMCSALFVLTMEVYYNLKTKNMCVFIQFSNTSHYAGNILMVQAVKILKFTYVCD